MKYITKVDEDHKGFKAVILTSAGIGKQYTENKHKRNKNKYQEDKTDDLYRDWETGQNRHYQSTTGTKYTQTKKKKSYG